MSLRKTTSNGLINELIGYDSEKLCLETLEKLNKDWTQRKITLIKVMMNLLNIVLHNTIITPNHINNIHNITIHLIY